MASKHESQNSAFWQTNKVDQVAVDKQSHFYLDSARALIDIFHMEH